MTGFTYLTFFNVLFIFASLIHMELWLKERNDVWFCTTKTFLRAWRVIFWFSKNKDSGHRHGGSTSSLLDLWVAEVRTHAPMWDISVHFLNSADYLPHHRPRVYVTGINQWRRCRRILSVPQLPFRQSLHISCFLHPGGSLSKLCFVVWQVTIIRNESWSSIAL